MKNLDVGKKRNLVFRPKTNFLLAKAYFTKLPSIYDGVSLQKWSTAKNRYKKARS